MFRDRQKSQSREQTGQPPAGSSTDPGTPTGEVLAPVPRVHHHNFSHDAIRLVALFEATKGTVVLLAGMAVLKLLDRDLENSAQSLIRHFHLDPASHLPSRFIRAASHVTPGQLLLLAGGAALYALVRYIEAYGLWRERRWAEWFAALSGGIYLPIEIWELSHGITPFKVAMLVINLALVGFMIVLLVTNKNGREPGGQAL